MRTVTIEKVGNGRSRFCTPYLIGWVVAVISAVIVLAFTYNYASRINRAEWLGKNTHSIASTGQDDAYNGYIVHTSGEASYRRLPIGPLGIEVEAAAAHLQPWYYLWVEHCATHTRGSGDNTYEVTECTWNTEWSSTWQMGDLTHFNPVTQIISTTNFATEFSLGDFTIDGQLAMEAECASTNFDRQSSGLFRDLGSGDFYRGYGTRWFPVIGDVWVRVRVFNPETASVIGQRNGFVISTGKLNGTETGLVSAGYVPAKVMVGKWLRRLGMWSWVAVGQTAVVAMVLVLACGFIGPAVSVVLGQVAATVLQIYLRGNQGWWFLALCIGASVGSIGASVGSIGAVPRASARTPAGEPEQKAE